MHALPVSVFPLFNILPCFGVKTGNKAICRLQLSVLEDKVPHRPFGAPPHCDGEAKGMPSFGRGNRALLEKDIVEREITDLNPQAVFQTRPDRERYLLDGRSMMMRRSV